MLMRNKQKPGLKGLVLVNGIVIATLVLPCTSFAEQWKFQPNITLEERYDDNVLLTTLPHESVTGTVLRGVLAFSRISETGSIVGRLHADANYYTGDEQVKNNNNIYFTSNAEHKSELSNLGLMLSYKRDSTIRNFDTIVIPDTEESFQDDDLDAGLVEIDIKRNTLKVMPRYSYQFSERSGLDLTYEHNSVQYDNNFTGSGLYDYERNRLVAGFVRSLSERDNVSISVGAARYESPDNMDNKVDSYELTVGYVRAISETTIGGLDIGVNDSKQTDLLASSNDTGFIVRANLKHETEVSKYRMKISHDLQPSGLGIVSEASQFNFDIRHDFSTRLKGILNMRYQQTKSGNNSLPAKNHYAFFEPSLSWNLSQWWRVAGGVKVRKGKRSTNAEAADSNAVFLSIGYSQPFTSD